MEVIEVHTRKLRQRMNSLTDLKQPSLHAFEEWYTQPGFELAYDTCWRIIGQVFHPHRSRVLLEVGAEPSQQEVMEAIEAWAEGVALANSQ